MNDATEIRWPDHYHPNHAPVHVRNEIDIAAEPEIVWAWLVRAKHWPAWYVNASNVQFADGKPQDLALGTRFNWKTFGVGIASCVAEFEPNKRIAWNGKAIGIDVYHAWLIVKTVNRCKVITEESQHEWLARLSVRIFPTRMWKFHQIWLESLRTQAERGLPPNN